VSVFISHRTKVSTCKRAPCKTRIARHIFEHLSILSYSYMSCNDNGIFIELYLQDFGLGGTLPSEIGYLSNLIKFDVAENVIEGSLSEQYGRLANLERMYFEHNQINGTIPTGFASLDSLFDLELGGNSLSGSLPKEMASLKSIKRIDISESSLTGSIPVEFFNLNDATEAIILKGDHLSRSIPTELGVLSIYRSSRI
jgi:hypothetical protein